MEIRSATKRAANRIVKKVDKRFGIINYDDDNCYPQRIMLLCNSSATTKACLDTYGRFIEGGGFKDTFFYKSIINADGQTNDKLLRLIRNDLAKFRGIAIHVNVNMLGKIVECYHVPFEHVRILSAEKRLETGGEYAIYHDWNCQIFSSIKINEIAYLPKINLNPDSIAEEVEKAGGWEQYKGQLIYISMDEGTYPLASCDVVIESMFAEIQSDVTTTNSVEQNFTAKSIFAHMGKFESDDKREEFETDIEEFMGPEGAPMIVVDISKVEDLPQIIPIPQTANDKQFEYTDSKITDKIIRNYLIPKILLSVTDGGGYFNQEQIRDATMYYNSVTLMERTLLEETFGFIGRHFDSALNATNDYSIIPVEFKVNKGQVPTGFIQFYSLNMDIEAKRNGLVILFGLTPEEALLMVPDGFTVTQPPRVTEVEPTAPKPQTQQ